MKSDNRPNEEQEHLGQVYPAEETPHADHLAGMLERCRRELAELRSLATVGMATLSIAHELGNYLNSMMLQASIVKTRVTGELAEKIEAIRSQGALAAEILRPLQRLRQSSKESDCALGVHSILEELSNEKKELTSRTQWARQEELPPLAAKRAEMLVLLGWLRDELLNLAKPNAPLVLETSRSGDRNRIIFTTAVEGVEAASLNDILDSEKGLLAHTNEIERLAVRAVLRQHEMELEAERKAPEELSLILSWKS